MRDFNREVEEKSRGEGGHAGGERDAAAAMALYYFDPGAEGHQTAEHGGEQIAGLMLHT
ncbi:MAG: hypothetical protein JWP63_3510 [Candidatus Solibacter sp.]|nr:hypothetical protein [Candidatus Solibacter sp.]